MDDDQPPQNPPLVLTPHFWRQQARDRRGPPGTPQPDLRPSQMELARDDREIVTMHSSQLIRASEAVRLGAILAAKGAKGKNKPFFRNAMRLCPRQSQEN